VLEIHATAVRAPGFRTLSIVDPIVIGPTTSPKVGDTAPLAVAEAVLEEVVL